MDGQRFDDLALGRNASRRGLAKTLLGGVVAAVAGLAAPRTAASRPCARYGQSCRFRDCCLGLARGFVALGSAQRRCNCRAGSIRCTDRGGVSSCVDDRSDPANCGGRGIACPPSTTRVDGQCHCPLDQALRGGIAGSLCDDIETDPHNCGGCGRVRATAAACLDGQCDCPPELQPCPTATSPFCCPPSARCTSGGCECPFQRVLCRGGAGINCCPEIFGRNVDGTRATCIPYGEPCNGDPDSTGDGTCSYCCNNIAICASADEVCVCG